MRNRVVAAVVCLTLLSGCTTKRSALVVTGLGVGTMAGTGIWWGVSCRDRPGESCGQALVALPIIGFGAVIAVGSLINLAILSAREPRRAAR